MRRGCLIAVGALLILCVVGCGLGYFVFLPRVQDGVRDEARDAIGTEVARQIALAPDAPSVAATYQLREDELNRGIADAIGETEGADDVSVAISPEAIRLTVTAGERETSYTGQVAAVDGRLDVTDMDADGFFTFFLTADGAAEAVEQGVNDYLTQQNLRLVAVELGQGVMSLEVEPAG